MTCFLLVFSDSLDTDELFSALENRIREETAVNVEDQGQIKFLIWVSFAEIYNEQIFDLLEPLPKKKNARRPVLKLSDDKHGSPYIKGIYTYQNIRQILVDLQTCEFFLLSRINKT